MGLLSDPEYGSVKWVRVLKKVHSPLCFIFYVCAIGWFFMLAHREFNNETYFSENALLPGLVTNEFDAEYSANKFYKEFLQELEDKYEDSDEMPVPWLVGKMSQLDLEVYTHNFTLNYPLGHGQVYKGTNVYGILRAPRTSSLEALVVTAPFRSLSSHQKGTAAGIGLMLAFAQFARPQKYWAKDIIFLITEHEQLGMQAWLEAYHGLRRQSDTFYTSLSSFWQPGGELFKHLKVLEKISDQTKCLDPGTLKGRSGSIQAAINLEFHTPKFKYIEVKVEGLNGQLPNLDLVNLVHKLCIKSNLHHSYKNSYSWIRTRNKMDEWMNNIWTMLGMVGSQIAGVPNGNHGLFHRFNIEALTLEGRDASDPGQPPRIHSLHQASFHRLGITLESILRSLNNLLERFHQSYFFYMLAATNRFISIGQYMPSLCLLCGAMLIRALSLWVTLQKDDEKDEAIGDIKVAEKDKLGNNVNDKAEGDDEEIARETDAKELTKEETQEITKDIDKDKSESVMRGTEDKVANITKDKYIGKEQTENNAEEKEELKNSRVNGFSLANIGGNYLLVHLMGYTVMNLPPLFTYIGAIHFSLASEVSVFYGMLSSSAIFILLSPKCLRTPSELTRDEVTVVNILMLIELSTACLAIGVHNFPLGVCLAALYTPLALIVGVVEDNKQGRLILFVKRVVCLLLQPLLILMILMILYSRVLFPEEGIFLMASRGKDAAMQAIMFSIVDSMIYGNWLFNIVCTVILPTWILSWQILWNKVQV